MSHAVSTGGDGAATPTGTGTLFLKAAIGRRVISRASAEEIGTVTRFVVDAASKHVAALVVGKIKKARVIEWSAVSGFGPDAIMVSDEESVGAPGEDKETATAAYLLGNRCLSELGNLLGTVDDATFDPATGALVDLVVGGRSLPASSLLGLGSYACVVHAGVDDVHPTT